jgi:glycosyltransferase involved in cell wall biosynthesis
MARKHVLLIGPFPPPIGGDTVLTLNVSRSAYWGDYGITLECVDTAAGDRVRVPGEALTLKDFLRGIRVFLELVARLPRCGAVLLFANNRFVVTVGLAIIAWSSLWRRPVFLKTFGAYFARQLHNTPEPRRKLARALLARTTFVFPETKALERSLVEEGWLPKERVCVLPNFLSEGSIGEPRAPKRFSGRCVFFGQIKREKGIFDIIEALGEATNVSCDFYGPLLPRDSRDFLAAIAKHPNLAYRGIVEPGGVSRAAAAYDVLLLPTYHESEGYPAVILEAYAAGIPVIATNWLGLPEIVEDGARGILVPVRSPAEIRKALDRLFNDAGLYESMRLNARAFVNAFSERAVLNEILIPLVARALR